MTVIFADALSHLESGRQAALAMWQSDLVNANYQSEVRIFELFEVLTWLTMPAVGRPANSIIVARLGDCNAEGRISNNEELAAFCLIVQARRVAQLGDANDAQRLLTLATRLNASSANSLSARWGLNFRQEMVFMPQKYN